MNAELQQPEDSADPDPETQYTYDPDTASEPPPEEWALVRYAGEPIGELIVLRSEETLLGRTSQADIYLPEPEVSRRHARITLRQEPETLPSVYLQDLGSINGTFHNGRRMEINGAPQRVSPGDILQIGIHIFKLKHLDEVERAYHETMLAQTTLDSLTGVSNRAAVLSFLEKQADLALRYGRPLSLVICDLDHFKEINDRWGHGAGDEVLAFFGALLQGRLRGSDLAGRIGGEEFLLVLPETSVQDALQVAEDLRQTLDAAEIQPKELPGPLHVTCCFGIAQLMDEDATGLAFLSRADAALYRAKTGGRNRVELDALS